MSQKHTVMDIRQIHADPNQPRQEFDPAAMAVLAESIAAKGILVPLVVEKNAQGYVLVDGERRFRTASKLGFKEVPVIVMDKMSDIERTVTRFNIHEHQNSWTPYEKALAINELQQKTGWDGQTIAQSLGVSPSAITDYKMLLSLSRSVHETGMKKRVSLSYMVQIARATRSLDQKVRSKVQERLVQMCVDGDFKSLRELTPIIFALKKNPEKVIRGLVTNNAYTAKQAVKDAHSEYDVRWRTFRFSISGLNGALKFFLGELKKGKKLSPPETIAPALKELLANVQKYHNAI